METMAQRQTSMPWWSPFSLFLGDQHISLWTPEEVSLEYRIILLNQSTLLWTPCLWLHKDMQTWLASKGIFVEESFLLTTFFSSFPIWYKFKLKSIRWGCCWTLHCKKIKILLWWEDKLTRILYRCYKGLYFWQNGFALPILICFIQHFLYLIG